MSEIARIAQPALGTTLDAIEEIMKNGGFESVDVAVAYITSGGIFDLLKRAEATLGGAWTAVEKRWITSFDYCRSEPLALKVLSSLPASSVRVHDAAFCLAHKAMPRVPFHPKMYLFRNTTRDYALAGSGNLSRSGLSRGVEAGLVLAVNRKNPPEQTSVDSINELRNWYSSIWKKATPLDENLLKQYFTLFDRAENLRTPTPTEDDIASGETGSGALSIRDLQKLRICRHFWIEGGKITRNRGPHLPGNQLMMKRLSRVFFGFLPAAVPENTLIGTVAMSFNGGALDSYSLTYSDNKMDKLVLPIPGGGGPAAYDNECLLFRKVGSRTFDLTLGTKADRVGWLNRSNAIGGAFKMSSGRAWGVF